jgi:rhodanese-related sulfurtransferase
MNMNTSKIKTATVQETITTLQQNPKAVLVDVREQDEVDEIAPLIGTFFPMSKINPLTFHSDCKVEKNQPLFILCKVGGRSMRVAAALADAGFTDLTNVTGGIMAWEAAGLPVKTGR